MANWPWPDIYRSHGSSLLLELEAFSEKLSQFLKPIDFWNKNGNNPEGNDTLTDGSAMFVLKNILD